MKISNKVKQIFYLYNIYLNRTKHPEILLGKYPEEELSRQMIKWTNYVKSVDSILNTINTEYKKLLLDVYVERKNIRDLHYSTSTFYIKRKLAFKEFADYVGLHSDNQLINSLGLIGSTLVD